SHERVQPWIVDIRREDLARLHVYGDGRWTSASENFGQTSSVNGVMLLDAGTQTLVACVERCEEGVVISRDGRLGYLRPSTSRSLVCEWLPGSKMRLDMTAPSNLAARSSVDWRVTANLDATLRNSMDEVLPVSRGRVADWEELEGLEWWVYGGTRLQVSYAGSAGDTVRDVTGALVVGRR